jgi:hypothetical protein
LGLGVDSEYTITFSPINKMPADSAFKMKYPLSVTYDLPPVTVGTTPSYGLTICTIVHKTLSYPMSGCSVDPLTKEISINGGFSIAVNEGEPIAITVGPFKNPIT